MEFFRAGESVIFSNSGITSNQLVCPENSHSERITITHLTLAPGAKIPPIATIRPNRSGMPYAALETSYWLMRRLRRLAKVTWFDLRTTTLMAS